MTYTQLVKRAFSVFKNRPSRLVAFLKPSILKTDRALQAIDKLDARRSLTHNLFNQFADKLIQSNPKLPFLRRLLVPVKDTSYASPFARSMKLGGNVFTGKFPIYTTSSPWQSYKNLAFRLNGIIQAADVGGRTIFSNPTLAKGSARYIAYVLKSLKLTFPEEFKNLDFKFPKS